MVTNGVQIKDAGTLDEALTGAELVAFQEPAGGTGSTKRTTTQAIADLAAAGTGTVDSVVAGANITVDATDPANPIVSSTATGTGTVESVVAGTNVTVDATDPANPIVSSTGGGAVDSVNTQTGAVVLDAADVGADPAGAAATAESNAEAYADSLAGNYDAAGTAASAVAAEATLARNADNLTSGTVADARIASTIARDSEVTSAVAAEASARDAAIAAIDFPVDSVDGQTGIVDLSGSYDALGAAATAQSNAEAASQPVDADLTTIAAIDSSASGVIGSDGAGWVAKTYAALKTALGLTKGDVGLGNVDNTADSAKTFTESQITNLTTDLADLQTLAAINADNIQMQLDAALGYYIGQGVTIAPNATPSRIDITASGMILLGRTDLGVAAATALGSTVATLGAALTAGQSMWVKYEYDASGIHTNAGSPGTPGVMPTTTAGRVVIGRLWIPFVAVAANAMDQLLTTPNNNAKLYAGGVTRPGVGPTGWCYDTNTWTFVSSTTGAGGGLITYKLSGIDATGYLTPGTKVSWDDGTNTPGYGVIATSTFSTDTTITLIKQSDYVMANATIKYARYSEAANPQGFPTWFNWSPTLSGWSSNPSSAVYQWATNGRSCMIVVRQFVVGTSNAVTHSATLPVAAATITNGSWQASGKFSDNATIQIGSAVINSAATTVLLQGILATSNNTNTGNSGCIGVQVSYPF